MEPALLRSSGRPVRFFDPRGTATGCLSSATMPDWNNDRAPCLVRPVPPAPAQQFLPKGENPAVGRQSGPGNPTLGQPIPPVPDLALPSHSTGAKP
jgi:hypothetical protein